ncbi:nucleotidyltransferase family protein [Meiothermus sp. QL-1]|nr:nucleotidyltransferase family protein [Meiothermus sp. QL-1]
MDAIVLAAGRASRLGVPKFLLPAGPGQVLLTRVLELVLGVVRGQVVVVLGHRAELARCALAGRPAAGRVRLVENPRYAEGQSSSLKRGLEVLGASAGAWVFLADMPGLDAERLGELARAIQKRPPGSLAVAPCLGGEARPPVFLSRELFPALHRLGGDQGARALLRAERERVVCVEWGPGLWSADVDTWADYRSLAWALGWAEEPPGPPLQPMPTRALAARIDQALGAGEAPWLAPGILWLPGQPEAWWRLSEPYRGAWAVAEAPAHTPGAYLGLLRRAALWALRAGPGH